MSAVRGETLALLDFLCAAHAAKCRVKHLNQFALRCRLGHLRKAGLVERDSHAPTAWAMHDWKVRQEHPKFAEVEVHEAGGCAPPVITKRSDIETSVPVDLQEPAAPPQPEADTAEGGGDARCADEAPPPMSGAELVKLIEDFADLHPEISISRLCQHLFNSKSARNMIVGRKEVGEELVARVRAVLADPPESVKRERRAYNPRKNSLALTPVPPAKEPVPKNAPSAPARRDPTTKPATPLMDKADAVRSSTARHGAAIRRGQEQNAAALVDAGVDPSTQHSFVAAQMRAVIARREAEARMADPVEQAKLAIRRRGIVVFNAEVSLGDAFKGQFYVGSRVMTKDEMFAYAKRLAA